MFHVQFHWYGFLIGLGLISGLYLTEYLFKKKHVPADFFWELVTYILIGGLIGSRAWHVTTDYQIYVGQWQNIFAIWNGGLSIIGTIFGAILSFWLFFYLHPQWQKYRKTVLDESVFGLALGQVIGRFGNYTNQELYGLPSNLPWSTYIDLSHRLKGFEQFSTFHPLFLYEAILLLIFLALAWKLQQRIFKVGTGLLFCFYIAYYSWIRFALDFLRIDKATSPFLGLGINQLVLLGVGIASTFYVLQKLRATS